METDCPIGVSVRVHSVRALQLDWWPVQGVWPAPKVIGDGHQQTPRDTTGYKAVTMMDGWLLIKDIIL